MRRILREYWLDIVLISVVGTGVLLVVTEVSIRDLLKLAFQNAVALLGRWEGNLVGGTKYLMTHFSLNDLLGAALAVVALVFILWRGRYHFYRSEYWQAVNCPKCGSGLHRIHRTTWDRFLSRTLLRGARRYQCKNRECGWTGLRQWRKEDQRRRRPAAIAPGNDE